MHRATTLEPELSAVPERISCDIVLAEHPGVVISRVAASRTVPFERSPSSLRLFLGETFVANTVRSSSGTVSYC